MPDRSDNGLLQLYSLSGTRRQDYTVLCIGRHGPLGRQRHKSERDYGTTGYEQDGLRTTTKVVHLREGHAACFLLGAFGRDGSIVRSLAGE